MPEADATDVLSLFRLSHYSNAYNVYKVNIYLKNKKVRTALNKKASPPGTDFLIVFNIRRADIGTCLCVGLDVDVLATLLAGGEYHNTVDQGEQSVVLAHAHVQSGVMNCAALTLNDVAGFAIRTTKDLYSESFAL